MFSFIEIDFFDILDIFIVAAILYYAYRLVRGTVAINIFIGISIFILTWLIVRTFNMDLLASIMGQLMSVGVIALLIVFQPEIRRFLLLLGSKYKFSRIFNNSKTGIKEDTSRSILDACSFFSKTKTGALIVFSRNLILDNYIDTGVILDAKITEEIIENIFFKNTPLHDGAIIITNNRISAARCILPISDRMDIPGSMGLRHRAALGLCSESDAYIIVVSEETGFISFFKEGEYHNGITIDQLRNFLNDDFTEF